MLQLLSQMIKKEFIQLQVEVRDWEDAIKQSAQPLLTHGKITAEYVEKIIEISRTTGPYIVITKHVALPHAPVEAGALASAMGITTLSNPVVSGNQANDPVKYLFCLSAKDSNSHLQAMSELVTLLSTEEFYDLLDHAQDPQEILNYITALEKGENDYA